MKPVAGALLALLVPFCFGCGHSAAATHGTRAPARFRPGAIAFWDARNGLALFGPPATVSGRWRDVVESTSDGGRTWKRLRSVANGGRIVAAGRSRAWLLTRRGLLRSDDRGVTWTRVSRYPLVDVSFATPRQGLGYGVRGTHELLAATSDGGRSWRGLRFPCPNDGGVDADDAVSLGAPLNGWVMCVGEPGAGSQRKRLFESDDGGRTWHRRAALGVGYFAGFSFRGGTGWLWEHRGSFLRSVDVGRSWSALAIGRPEQVEAESASFYSATGGLALLHDVRHGARLRLARTADGGRSWQEVRSWAVRIWPAV
jgi:photosystem II stability/assembly factor-like uncharacterized protein